MLLQVAVQEDLLVHQMDVKTAFLNAPIDEDIYIEQPKGFEVYNSDGIPLVCKLNRSLYGLKQSGRNWNGMLHDLLIKNSFKQSLSDACMYTIITNESKLIVLIWVDDIIIAGSDLQMVNTVKDMLSNNFKMKDMGPLSWFLNIQFKNMNGSVKMNQTKLIEQVLTKFCMSDCKPKTIPCDPTVTKIKESDSKLLDDVRLYQSMVGSLIYIMTCTRPDICFSVTMLSQYLKNPTQAHLNCAKHVLRYLKATKDMCLEYSKSNSNLRIMGYSDSDWANGQDRKSISGFCFTLKETLICWKSRKQSNIALSTCEAEYVALSSAVQEAKFLKQLYGDMVGDSVNKNVVEINVDNQGAIALAKNPVNHKRSKHIDIKFHHIRAEVQNGNVVLNYVPTEHNLADIFTKPVSRQKLNHLYFKM